MLKRFLYLFLAVAVLLTCAPMTVSFAAAGDQNTASVNVAAGKAAEILTGESGYSAYPFENVNDGKINSSWGGKITGGGYVSFVVDLGRQYAIDEIVIYDRHDSPGPYRTYFELSGSDTKEGTYTAFYTMHESAGDTNFPAKGSLAITNSTVTATDNEGTVTSTTEGGFAEAKPTYRYIKYRCTYSNGVCWVGELIVNAQQTTTELADGSKVINPDFYGAAYSAENKTITLDFSDEMQASSINKNSVRLYRKEDNALVNYTSIVTAGHQAVITLPAAITAAGGTFTVSADNTVTNTSGTAITAKSYDVTVTADAETPVETTTETKLVNVAKNKIVEAHNTRSGSPSNLTDGNYMNNNYWVGDPRGTSDTPIAEIENPTAAYAVIDLGRRYQIEKIALFARGDVTSNAADARRCTYKIYGSDEKDTSKRVLIAESNMANDDTIYPLNGTRVISLQDTKPTFRYVWYEAYEPTHSIQLREIHVYSEVHATNVTQGKRAYSTVGDSKTQTVGISAASMVNGNITPQNTWYRNQNNTYTGLNDLVGTTTSKSAYQAITIDMGQRYHLDMVEVYGSSYSNNNGFYGPIADFRLFGSVNALSDVDLYQGQDAKGSYYSQMSEADFTSLEDYDYTLLDNGVENLKVIKGATAPTDFSAITNFMRGADTTENTYWYDEVNSSYLTWTSFAMNDNGNVTYYEPYPMNIYNKVGATGNCVPYVATVQNNAEGYQYLTWRNGTKDRMSLNEIKGYIFHPEAYALSKVTKTGATIKFSDFNMDSDTLLSNISLEGVDGAVTAVTVAEGSADAVIAFDPAKLTVGETYTLTVGTGAANTYGVALAEEASFTFVYGGDYAVLNPEEPAIISNTGANTYSFTLANNAAAEKDVIAAIALYNGDELLAVTIQKQSVAADTLADFSVSATNASGKTVTSCKTFIWDAVTLAPII